MIVDLRPLYRDPRPLLALCPPDARDHLHDLLAELGSAAHRHRDATTWQQLWNTTTGARPGRAGTLTLRNVRCPTCRGRGFDVHHPQRNLTRTGNPYVCATCRGTRSSDLTLTVQHADTPDPAGTP